MKVIEGDDSKVGKDREGYYWAHAPDSNFYAQHIGKDQKFQTGWRYIKTDPPAFPPPVPAKPELKLYRVKVQDAAAGLHAGYLFWGLCLDGVIHQLSGRKDTWVVLDVLEEIET